MNSNISRFGFVDWLKTICIILVLFGHLLPDTYRAFIYSFHIPTLFIVLGFLHSKKSWSNLITSLFLLFVPVILFSFLRCVYFGFESFCVNPLGISFTGLWYIINLACLRLLFSFKCIQCNKIIIGMLCLIMCELLSYLIRGNGPSNYLFYLLPSIPFYVLGLYLRERGIPEPANLRKIAILLFFYFGWSYLQGNCYIYPYYFPLGYLLFSFGATIITFLLYSITMNFRIYDFVESFSKGTLLLLGTNVILCDIINKFCIGKLYNYWWIISFILSLFVSYPLIVLCLRYFPFLLGKRKVCCMELDKSSKIH